MSFIPDLPTLLVFSAACLLLAATPGPDMTLSISRALRDGRMAGLAVLIGTNIGITVHTLLVAFGVSALIVASPTAFLILKSGGAAYLAWLAFQAVRHGSKFVAKPEAGVKGNAKAAFLNGIWVNLLNPKVIIFFMTFLPQFVTAHDPNVTGKLIFLGFWFMLISLPVTIAIVLAADKLAGWLQSNPKVLRGMDYTFAGVFSVFAAKILMTQAR
ncbi:LysE family translocator [Allorhizobium taibaishanense]|uniref:Threonine transporter RhtB n=1 Tax=Allorhizobium taibaishanense TaxID=887144 RepID=A0A1Q9A1S1_9HYPH|nr:LysE family translocator [Allorhizobium taibaishanense]MBB4009173.1 threonine/homoserine/homoserine lactone efflux protein [Allorhizobium taibaishanense]OLP48550.1 threonine transporter RhtB [Allorhizobium taibaishanense]